MQFMRKMDVRLRISDDSDFGALQRAIEQQCGVPVDDQRLVLKGREVDRKLRVENLNCQVRNPRSCGRCRASLSTPLAQRSFL